MAPESPPKSEYARALDCLTRYLALRDHSRFELQTKLRRRFDAELVQRVLCEAEERGWLDSEEEIAARMALALERRLKSRRYIEAQLRKRQLPLPAGDEAAEVERARAVAGKRFGVLEDLSFHDKARVFRYLKYRGFSDRTIQQVFHAKS